jgi:hypothetical protein
MCFLDHSFPSLAAANGRLPKNCGNRANKSKKAATRHEISTIHDFRLDDAAAASQPQLDAVVS